MRDPSHHVALVSVQMRVALEDYQSVQRLATRVDQLIASAKRQVPPNTPTLVVFPEDVGLGMLFLDDYEAVQGCRSIYEAAGVLFQRYAEPVRRLVEAHRVSPTRALLLTLGGRLESRYRQLFSRAARQHRVTLVAGSAPLPNSQRRPEVYNACYVFDPQGRLILRQHKVNLIPLEGQEGMGLSAGRMEDLRVVDTPVGKLGVAICLDAFHTEVIEALVQRGAHVIAQPSFNPLPWTPEQAESWRESLWRACQRHPALIGVNPMMVGKLFDDVVVEGRSSIVAHASLTRDGSGYLALAQSATEEEVLVVQLPREATTG